MMARSKDAEAAALLAELLDAFGLARARTALDRVLADQRTLARKRSEASRGLAEDVDRPERHRDEKRAALPTLRACVDEVRALRARELLRPREYRTRWQAIIEQWNGLLYDQKLVTLPPLCEVCGSPVLLRRLERQKKNVNVEIPTVCSERCRTARKARNRTADPTRPHRLRKRRKQERKLLPARS